MNKIIRLAYILPLFCLVVSCDITRLPEDKIVPENFFKNEDQCQLWLDRCYDIFMSSPNSTPRINADDMIDKEMPELILGTRLVTDSNNDQTMWGWESIRRLNEFFQYCGNCTDESVRNKYKGVAYFFRAYAYYYKVLHFGDVPYYDTVIGSSDTELLDKKRDDRGYVMGKIMDDIDNAILLLPSTKDVSRVTKWTALALKSRIALFEGTWRKYHNLPDADKYLQLCVDASEELISNGGYKLYTDGSEPYRDLFCSEDAKKDEVILARIYNYSSVPTIKTTIQFNISDDKMGFTKRFMNHYLMKDGSRFTDISGYQTMTYTEETKNRDPRMSQTVLCPGYIQKDETAVTTNDLSGMTGYIPIKFVGEKKKNTDGKKGTNDYPCFRIAETFLNYAEAKAELGDITQADIDKTINLIRSRVKMPALNLAAANASPDPYLLACYPNVTKSNCTGVILEIRRERTIELVMEGFRQDDMLRWHEGAMMTCLGSKWLGIYIPGPGLYDMNSDGINDTEIYESTPTTNKTSNPEIQIWKKLGSDITLSNGNSGYIVPYIQSQYTWNEDRDYLWPIPAKQRTLTNGALTQNPGWVDGIVF